MKKVEDQEFYNKSKNLQIRPTMFYHISLEHEIMLHPRYFGPQLMATVRQKLFSDVEGTCSGKYGFVVAVTTIDSIGAGNFPFYSALIKFYVCQTAGSIL